MHCVGGPLNGCHLTITSGALEFPIGKAGKYVYTPAGHIRFGTGECWVWHQFIS